MNLHFFRAHVLGMAITSIPVITEATTSSQVAAKAPKENGQIGSKKATANKRH